MICYRAVVLSQACGKKGTGFPRYLKVTHSYENICKLKWHKEKKNNMNLYGKILGYSQTPKNNLFKAFLIAYTISC